ncbi:hypothetical protein Tco_1152740 [Tanacetum coccineum]
MGSNEETNAAGTDTRPPMLVESDYDSWKDLFIHRYILRQTYGKLLGYGIYPDGPTPSPYVSSDPPPTDSTISSLPDPSSTPKIKPSTAKEIWDNVEMLMQGSAVNDIEDYSAQHSNSSDEHNVCQQNLPAFGHTSSSCQNDFRNRKQSQSIVVPMAIGSKDMLLGCVKNPRRKEGLSVLQDKALLMEAKECLHAKIDSQENWSIPQPIAQSPNDALMATMTQIANLLSGFQKQFPPSTTSSDFPPTPRIMLGGIDGHIWRQGHVDSSVMNQENDGLSVFIRYSLLMEAKEKGDVLDAER